MIVKILKRDEIIKANEIAIKNDWKHHFKEHNFDEYDQETNWPIVFYAKIHKDRTRVLFEHDNGELYQLDVENNLYNSLSEKEIEDIVLN